MTSPVPPVAVYNPDELTSLLPVYYKMIFPSDLFYSWLSYSDDKRKIPVSDGEIKKENDENSNGPNTTSPSLKLQRNTSQDNYFTNREFSFTLPGDIFVRYKSFSSGSELTAALVRDVPIKFDIGAVFSSNPKYVKRALENTIRPIERELVFDIDMTDYDELRKCCQGAAVCNKCWKFMAIAAKILDHRLRKDFGFKHILWVYSGRRGIHCWVCDERARKLGNDARGAIVSYLTLIEGGAMKKKRVNLTSSKIYHPHPMVVESVKAINPYFEKILEEQDVLKTTEDIQSFFKLFGNSNVQALLRRSAENNDYWSKLSASEKYQRMAKVAAFHFKPVDHSNDLGKFYDEEIKLQYCYPRLDINVSKGINHLLKAPFCIHPKTGRVCIPFDVHAVDSLNPSDVPTIKQILLEIDEFDKNSTASGSETTYKDPVDKTSLRPSIQLFTRFINNLRADRLAAVRSSSAKSLDF